MSTQAPPTTANRALVRQRGGLAVVDVGARAPGPGEVQLRVLVAGLCRTDVAVARGLLAVDEPRVIGHECAGVVEAIGAGVTGFAPGDTVAVVPLVGCGTCSVCAALAAAPHELWRCPSARMLGVDLDGGFAERLTVPAHALLRAPAGLDPRRIALVEPIAAATAVLAEREAGARVGLTGAGRIAELTRRALLHAGLVLEGGAAGDLDAVIETGGTQASLSEALARVRSGGLVVLKSRPPKPLALDVADIVRRGIRLVGANYGPFDGALALAADPRFELDDLIGPTFGLEDFEAACDAGEAKKVFLAPCAG